jgi:hypothetical protein
MNNTIPGDQAQQQQQQPQPPQQQQPPAQRPGTVTPDNFVPRYQDMSKEQLVLRLAHRDASETNDNISRSNTYRQEIHMGFDQIKDLFQGSDDAAQMIKDKLLHLRMSGGGSLIYDHVARLCKGYIETRDSLVKSKAKITKQKKMLEELGVKRIGGVAPKSATGQPPLTHAQEMAALQPQTAAPASIAVSQSKDEYSEYLPGNEFSDLFRDLYAPK